MADSVNTTSVIRGNRVVINRAAVMKRAWQIIREQYTFAGHFSRPSCYRQALAWALSKAWSEAKDALLIAAMSDEEREFNIACLKRQIEHLSYRPLGHSVQRERANLERKITALAA